MRQIGDLLVWLVMIMALVAVLYLTPRVASYMSDETRPATSIAPGRSLVLMEPSRATEPVQ
jgi:hypothetical protein